MWIIYAGSAVTQGHSHTCIQINNLCFSPHDLQGLMLMIWRADLLAGMYGRCSQLIAIVYI